MSDTKAITIPPEHADLHLQIGAAIEQLRIWYPTHFIRVASNFTYYEGRVSLKWELFAMDKRALPHTGQEHPHSYECATLAEALASMKHQVGRVFDVETVNAQLADAARDEALWCHEPRAYDYTETWT